MLQKTHTSLKCLKGIYIIKTFKLYLSRATRKLGQAQAVYGDGEFRSTNDQDPQTDAKKPSKKEVESLLKKGMLSFLN